jgi:hypothetical protein
MAPAPLAKWGTVLELSRKGEELDRAGGVTQHHLPGGRQLKGAFSGRYVATRGGILETAGSACDLISLELTAYWMRGIRDIDARSSLCELDRQETSIFEAKHPAAGHKSKIRAETAAATARGLRAGIVGPQATIGERSQRTVTGHM